MDYKNFKNFIIDALNESLSEEYTFLWEKVRRNNAVMDDALCIKRYDSDLAPAIYLDDYFNLYESGEASLDEIFEQIFSIATENDLDFDCSMIADFNKVKNLIHPRLFGLEGNEEFLKTLPYTSVYGCFAVTYVIKLEFDGQAACLLITNKLFNKYGITVDKLHKLALANMEPCKIISLTDYFIDLYEQRISSLSSYEYFTLQQLYACKEAHTEEPMYMITNHAILYGANQILDKNVLKQAENYAGKNYYILPSSVHECLVVPSFLECDPDSLRNMVRDVNSTAVPACEVLSNSVLQYDSSTGEVHVVK